MKSLVKMTTVAAMAGMLLSLAGLDAEAGRRDRDRDRDRGRNNETSYRVVLKHPESGSVLGSQTVATLAEARELQAEWEAIHWVLWQYVGINEPHHEKKFNSPSEANSFTPPFGILNYQRVKAANVTVVQMQRTRR